MLSYAVGGLRLKSPVKSAQKTKKNMKHHDCSGRSNTVGHQLTNLEALQKQICEQDAASCDAVEEVNIIGDESGEIVSNDPNHPDAQLAEAIGTGSACGKGIGTPSIVEYNGKAYLLGNAHAFYANGKLKCNKKTAVFAPDYHYKGNPNMNHMNVYRFKLPPLNHKTAAKSFPRGFYTSNAAVKDIVILELTDDSILTNQLGKKRRVLKIPNIKDKNLLALSEETPITVISNRSNFKSGRQTSIQKNCQIRNLLNTSSKMKKHTCDTGNGSSGAPLVFNDKYFAGIHSSSLKVKAKNNISNEDFKYTNRGNHFIPISYIQDEFERTLGPVFDDSSI